MTGARLDVRRLTLLTAGVVAAGVLLVGLDAALGGSSHVTDAVGDGPGSVLGDIGDRLELSARRTFTSFGPAFAVLASLPVLAWVATRRPRRAITDALLVALAVSLLVNDTPGDVVGIGAAIVFMVRRFEDAPRSGPDRLTVMRRPVIALVLMLGILALVAVGCGGEEVTATPETVEGTIPEETTGGTTEDLPALELTGNAENGESLFADGGCGACHALAAAGSNGQVGPNLDESKPSYELAVQRITLGQGGMPAFAEQFEPQQIADVAQYVVASSGG